LSNQVNNSGGYL